MTLTVMVLSSADNAMTTFFWQDHAGSGIYVSSTFGSSSLCQFNGFKGGDDGKLTLFINDYNLKVTGTTTQNLNL